MRRCVEYTVGMISKITHTLLRGFMGAHISMSGAKYQAAKAMWMIGDNFSLWRWIVAPTLMVLCVILPQEKPVATNRNTNEPHATSCHGMFNGDEQQSSMDFGFVRRRTTQSTFGSVPSAAYLVWIGSNFWFLEKIVNHLCSNSIHASEGLTGIWWLPCSSLCLADKNTVYVATCLSNIDLMGGCWKYRMSWVLLIVFAFRVHGHTIDVLWCINTEVQVFMPSFDNIRVVLLSTGALWWKLENRQLWNQQIPECTQAFSTSHLIDMSSFWPRDMAAH